MARLGAEAVNRALRALKGVERSTSHAAALEAFLVARRLAALGKVPPTINDVNEVVRELFEVIPGHPHGRLAPFRWGWAVAEASGRKTVWNQTTRSSDNDARRLFKPR